MSHCFLQKVVDACMHPLLSKVRYCIKVNGEEHFKFLHHNVSAHDMNEGKMKYAKFVKVRLNNCMGLSHSNVLQRAHQSACFCMKKTFRCNSSQHSISHVQEWAIQPESNMGYSIKIGRYGCEERDFNMEDRHDIKMEDISNVIFDIVSVYQHKVCNPCPKGPTRKFLDYSMYM